MTARRFTVSTRDNAMDESVHHERGADLADLGIALAWIDGKRAGRQVIVLQDFGTDPSAMVEHARCVVENVGGWWEGRAA